MQRLALWLYGVLVWLATPLLLRKLRRRAIAEPGYGQAIEERFGYYVSTPHANNSSPTRRADAPLIWLHAVSLGETRAAAIVLTELRALLPGMRLLLTHGTTTGRAEGAKLLHAGDVQVWQPWDTPAAVRRFVRHWQPSIGVLLETEVWPNLVAGCRSHGVPLVLANARLNEKSHAHAQRLAWLARPAYAGLTAVWAQSEGDAQRLRDVGAQVKGVLGNVKFDVQPDAAQQALGRAWRTASARPVVLLASSREGEEALWLQALREKATPVQWLIVPRHPQRVDAVQQLCEAAGYSVSRRSQWTHAPQPADIWLGDSMGEMALYYSMADVALLGGSFAPLGGQNLLEAIACHCPVIMGPHTFNFAQAAALAEQAQVARRVPDMAAAVALACRQAAIGQAQWTAQCSAFMAAHQGAARATAVKITEYLP